MLKNKKIPRQSIVRDVEQSLKMINRIGHSKYDSRKLGIKGMIHSKKQMEHDFSACMNFAKWAKFEFGLRRMHEVKFDHVKAYLDHKRAEGVGVGHLQNIETSLIHLQKGSQAYFKQFEVQLDPFMPKGRITSPEGRKAPQNRSYTDKEYRVVLKNSSKNVQNAVKLMRNLGFRVDEVVKIRAEHFVKGKEGGLHVKIGKNESITKGGRFRDIPVRESFRAELEQMLQDKMPGERLITVHQNAVRNGVNRAFKRVGLSTEERGAHGFRHAYARERVQEEFQKSVLGDRGYAMLQRCFRNREAGRRADYGVFRKEDRQLYNDVKRVVDRIHSELGHGKDRWDLAQVYMS